MSQFDIQFITYINFGGNIWIKLWTFSWQSFSFNYHLSSSFQNILINCFSIKLKHSAHHVFIRFPINFPINFRFNEFGNKWYYYAKTFPQRKRLDSLKFAMVTYMKFKVTKTSVCFYLWLDECIKLLILVLKKLLTRCFYQEFWNKIIKSWFQLLSF